MVVSCSEFYRQRINDSWVSHRMHVCHCWFLWVHCTRSTKKVSFMLQDMHTHQRYCKILRTRVTKENGFKSRKLKIIYAKRYILVCVCWCLNQLFRIPMSFQRPI
ncbi:hypothetical protein HanOQP8_Chr07g0248561 [Helianthus annuus]|nr:hypothetical protein HanLR1_Chr07g0241001 [Helianthus annuus]KAJ0731141.1 hypothetical protein HanOQP8_Chr07g0248561 [Helianthus annuus]